jgi:sporulation protein YlmC with PRC-barrel domain
MKGMIGYEVVSPEGVIGSVADFHVDRKNWALRYLVVKLDNIDRERKVFISPANLIDKPDWGTRSFALKISMKTAEKAAGALVESPVTREDEEKIHTFFGLDFYWALEEPVKDGGHKTGKETGHNLSSLSGIMKYKIEASDGKCGRVMDLVLDDENWRMKYIAVSTDWFGGKKVLVPPQCIRSMELDKATMVLDITKEELKTSLKYDLHADVDRDVEGKRI